VIAPRAQREWRVELCYFDGLLGLWWMFGWLCPGPSTYARRMIDTEVALVPRSSRMNTLRPTECCWEFVRLKVLSLRVHNAQKHRIVLDHVHHIALDNFSGSCPEHGVAFPFAATDRCVALAAAE
jgi:hypothetical protein